MPEGSAQVREAGQPHKRLSHQDYANIVAAQSPPKALEPLDLTFRFGGGFLH